MPGPIRSIERAAAILRLLSGRSRRLGVVELAGELSLPKGTVFGILKTLRDVGFVEQDRESGKYQLGAAMLHMGSSYLDGNELRRRARGWADELAVRSGESVRIGTPHEDRVLIVHHVLRPDETRQALDVGSLLPAHATALGKALLANDDHMASTLDDHMRTSFTPATVIDLYRLRGELEETARRGWATDVGELIGGVASVAAPIEDRRRVTVGSIGITGPIERLCVNGRPRAELVDQVVEAARGISRELD